MESIVGTFISVADAQNAMRELGAVGIPAKRMILLTPQNGASRLESLETSETEQPGVGKAIGAVVGGAAGAVAGLSVVATALIPGIGAVTLLALAAGATVGAVGVASLADALEKVLGGGLPIDEVYVYEDALRKGRSVVIAHVDREDHVAAVRDILHRDGAESVDAACEELWAGLRSAEEREYEADGGDFKRDEADFRLGFEVAQMPGTRGQSYGEAEDYLRQRYPKIYAREAFRRGYERGRAHQDSVTII